jgi:hypothetical protein
VLLVGRGIYLVPCLYSQPPLSSAKSISARYLAEMTPPAAPRRFSGIRRSRPSYSCESCRARRVKCDQVLPLLCCIRGALSLLTLHNIQSRPKCANCVRNDVDCIYGEATLKRKDPPSDSAKSETPVKAVRRTVDGEDIHTDHGYLLLQNGGRSRYIENTFWAAVDIEVRDSPLPSSDLPSNYGLISGPRTRLSPLRSPIISSRKYLLYCKSR